MINRREFSGGLAMAAGAGNAWPLAHQGTSTRSDHNSDPVHTSFRSLKQVDAGVLNVGYAEAGPADGPPVILLHGWPYDIHSYVDVAPLLAAAGFRVIVPYLRGYGTTRFLSDATRSATASKPRSRVDVIALMDALDIPTARCSAGSTGAHGRPTWSPRCGRSGARPWCR